MVVVLSDGCAPGPDRPAGTTGPRRPDGLGWRGPALGDECDHRGLASAPASVPTKAGNKGPEHHRRAGRHHPSPALRDEPTEIYVFCAAYTSVVAKHLVDLDEKALSGARAELGTTTIKGTVNEALRQTISQRQDRVTAALDTLADAELDDRSAAWR